ncbi:MAG: DUF2029 domain-containing protein [Deltaproteobacteria bacterium]|nr:DUF2029 domain-containing protein [Deltaproteobacteria bacterium]
MIPKYARYFLPSGLFSVFVLMISGIWITTQRGGQDFNVFYHAWKLVLSGQASDIYNNSPDRFLYSPSFACLLSPLAWMPFHISFLFWNTLKIISLVLLFFILKPYAKNDNSLYLPLYLWSLIFISRPLLIDFQYGQINIFLLVFSLWALCSQTTLSWFFLGIVAVMKPLILPLLLIPWFERRKAAYISSLAGALLSILFPVVLGFQNFQTLLSQWYNALASKGFPLESHNQSVLALLYRLFSGKPIHIISYGPEPVQFGFNLFSEKTLFLLCIAWIIAVLVFFLKILITQKQSIQKYALLVGIILLPLHLVWKPYFVFSFPLAFLILRDLLFLQGRKMYKLFPIALTFTFMNLTGLDYIGTSLSGKFEALSIMMLAHLILIFYAYTAANHKDL